MNRLASGALAPAKALLRHPPLVATALATGTLAAALAACGRPGEGREPGSASPPASHTAAGTALPAGSAAALPGKRELRVATYNAGLAVGVLKYADERAEPLVRVLAEQPADLLCVQEFWLEEHWRMLVEKTASTLPNTYRLAAESKGGTCQESEVAPLATCAASHCAAAPAHDIAMCLLRGCGKELSGLSAGCFECLAGNPRARPEAIFRACVPPSPATPSARPPAGNKPPRRGVEDFRVYAGSYGTGILTSAQILEREAKILPSALDSRAVLYTRLRTPIGELDAYCTHLTANLSGVPHPGGASWRRDQSAQIDALLAFVEEKSAGRPAILLGDLNTGPAIGAKIEPSLPDHYARIVKGGFLNPYAAQKDATCTYCFDNPLDGGSGTRGLLIDHVLLRGFSGRVLGGGQIMRPAVTVAPGGKPVRIGPSDHYGVSVTLVPDDS